jgi:hypothetical protein
MFYVDESQQEDPQGLLLLCAVVVPIIRSLIFR